MHYVFSPKLAILQSVFCINLLSGQSSLTHHRRHHQAIFGDF